VVAEALAAQGLAREAGGGTRPRARFFATDSPERFARVGEIFLGRPIDASEVELVDLRPG
jgi:glutamate racemase